MPAPIESPGLFDAEEILWARALRRWLDIDISSLPGLMV
jgi:hypothetical protein